MGVVSIKFLTACVIGLVTIAATACDSPRDAARSEQWTLSGTPSLVIGSTTGDSVFLFDRVRTARFASGGRIVVADGGLQVVRVFDSEGRFLNQFGRPGEGPGEFGNLRDVWMASPDTVGVWDSKALRFTYFTLDGELTRTVTVRPPSGLPASPDFLVGALSDGSVVLGAITAERGADRGGRPDGVHLAHFDATGQFMGTIAVVYGLVRAQMGRTFGPVPFSPFPYGAVLRDSVLFTNGSRASVRMSDLDWHGRDIVFRSEPVQPDSAWTALVAALQARSDWQLQVLPDAPHPDSIPRLAGLLVDDQGRIWTKRFDPSTDAVWLGGGLSGGGTWWIADASTGETAEIALPESLKPVDVQGNKLLGVLTDSLGVQRIAEYAVAPTRGVQE